MNIFEIQTVENIVALLNYDSPNQLNRWIKFIKNHKDHVFFQNQTITIILADVGSQSVFEDNEKLLGFLF